MNIASSMIFLLLQLLVAKPFPSNEGSQEMIPTQAELLDDGLTLLKKHCYACHNPNTNSHDDIIAPPLAGIKKHYSDAYPEKADFSKAMMEFVKNPTAEKSLMKGPVKRFGLMPKPVVSEEEIKQIVTYIRDSELEKPKWFDAHEKGHGG
ncbi:c-type cytochrome [Algoriphagus marinus]|uniref:c-type cytochrome n=1 Tax=Algoriphagus marinus TaxID=1925762 RepID=UPI00094B79D8|nr:c-type cytochrome [Algoriphagus marinus]